MRASVCCTSPKRARNAGLAVATAPYVGFVDSDDYIEPDMFRRLYDAAVESGAQIAYGDLIYEEEGTPQPAEPAGPVTVRTPDEVLCDLLLERISASACTKLFEGLQFPLDVWFEDHRVVHEWVARCRRIAHVEKVCYHYVQRTEALPLLSGQFRAFRVRPPAAVVRGSD